MIWALAVVGLAILSYLADMGILPILHSLKVPGLGASIMSILLILCGLGMMTRVGHMEREKSKSSGNE